MAKRILDRGLWTNMLIAIGLNTRIQVGRKWVYWTAIELQAMMDRPVQRIWKEMIEKKSSAQGLAIFQELAYLEIDTHPYVFDLNWNQHQMPEYRKLWDHLVALHKKTSSLAKLSVDNFCRGGYNGEKPRQPRRDNMDDDSVDITEELNDLKAKYEADILHRTENVDAALSYLIGPLERLVTQWKERNNTKYKLHTLMDKINYKEGK